MNGSITQQISHGTIAPTAKQHSGSSKGTVGRNEIRDSQLYKRILGQSLNQVGMGETRHSSTASQAATGQSPKTPHLVPPKSSDGDGPPSGDSASQRSVRVTGLTEEENAHLVHQVAEMAATAATIAARDATRAPRKVSAMSHASTHHTSRASAPPTAAFREYEEAAGAEVAPGHAQSGGHDAPNWSRFKSAIILLGATVLYAVIAEILVNTVDVVLESVDVDEKFLGITLFALVPNTTEFLVSALPSSGVCIADVTSIECYILRYERQHCVVDGDWVSIRSAGVLATDSSTGAFQRHSWAIHRSQ